MIKEFFSLGNPLFYILMTMFLLFSVTYIILKRLIIPLEKKHVEEKNEIALVNEKLISFFTTLSPDPVFRFDPNGIIVMTNIAGSSLNPRVPIVGQNIKALFPDMAEIDLRQFIEDAMEYSLDAKLYDQTYNLKLKGVPELNAGHIYCANITERKRIEQALIAAKEKAEEMDRLKSSFLANMSHELRTPLTGILGYSEALIEDMEEGQQRDFVEVIHSSGMRLLETLNLILDLSKIQSEKLEIFHSRIDLIKEIREAVELYRPQAEKKKLSLQFTAEVPSLTALSDARLLNQIISNLVNNAIKYTIAGSVEVSVTLMNSFPVNRLRIQVKDTGIGIPQNKQAIIWDEFRQVSEGYGRFFEGTGLGLTVTKNFVAILNGEIELQSEIGKGSTFTVSLPLNGADQSPV